MRQHLSILALAGLLACGGGTSPSSSPSEASSSSDVESQVEAAVRKHLSRRSDLDMSAMEMTIQGVDVQGDAAVATVGFQVKGTPEAAMSMKYNLAKQNGEWVVQANPAGHGAAAPPPSPQPAPSQGLPPGHPPTTGEQPAQELPPGHPPVAQ